MDAHHRIIDLAGEWAFQIDSLDKGGDIAIGFSSIFWNTAWTNKQAPHTLGILCNPNHRRCLNFRQNHAATISGGMR